MRCNRDPGAAPARSQWQHVQAPQCFAEAWQQPQCAIATLHSPEHLVHTEHKVGTVYTAVGTLFTLQLVHTDPYCALYTVQSTLHIIHSDLRVWTVNCTLYTVDYTIGLLHPLVVGSCNMWYQSTHIVYCLRSAVQLTVCTPSLSHGITKAENLEATNKKFAGFKDKQNEN